MIKLKYFTYGEFKKILKISDKDFTSMLLTKSLEYSHCSEFGDWYRDCGMGVYLKINQNKKGG